MAGILAHVPPGHYTYQQAAQEVGRSAAILRRYARSGVFEPSKTFTAGKLEVAVYTQDDIEDLRRFLDRQRRGRPGIGDMRPIGRVAVRDLRKDDVIEDMRKGHETEYGVVERVWPMKDQPKRRVIIYKSLSGVGPTVKERTWSTAKVMVYVPVT